MSTAAEAQRQAARFLAALRRKAERGDDEAALRLADLLADEVLHLDKLASKSPNRFHPVSWRNLHWPVSLSMFSELNRRKLALIERLELGRATGIKRKSGRGKRTSFASTPQARQALDVWQRLYLLRNSFRFRRDGKGKRSPFAKLPVFSTESVARWLELATPIFKRSYPKSAHADDVRLFKRAFTQLASAPDLRERD